MKKFAFFILSALLVGGCAGPTTVRTEISDVLVAEELKKQKALLFQSFFDYSKRLANVSYPLQVAATPICEEKHKTLNAGFYFYSAEMFPENLRDTAILNGFSEALQIAYISLNSPAHISGLQEGDVLVSFDGKNLPVGDSDRTTKLWKESIEDGIVNIGVYRDGKGIDIAVRPIIICNYPISYVDDPTINAYADGDAVYITKGFMRFADNVELAAVIAHEIGHNVMQHIEAKQVNAIGGGVLDILVIGLTGVDPNIRSATAQAHSQEFEAEADYVGVYIMARASMDIDDVANLWRRMGVENAGSLEKDLSSSHPSSPERFVGLENAVKEVKQKIANGEKLLPNLKK